MLSASRVIDLFVHCPGRGDLDIIPSTAFLVTCGEDGMIKVTDPFTEKTQQEFSIENSIHAIALTKDSTSIIAALGDNSVRIYHLKNGEMDSILFRSTIPIRSISCSTKYIAVAGDDPIIRLINQSDPTDIITLKSHTAAIKHIRFDSIGTYLSSSSVDGFIKVFQVSDGKVLYANKSISDSYRYEEDMLCKSSWNSQGTQLATCRDNSIDVISISNWKRLYSLEDKVNGHKEPVTISMFSPNDLYICSTALDSMLFLWDVGTKEILRSFRLDSLVCSLFWEKKEGAIALLDMSGHYSFLRNNIPSDMTSPHLLSLPTTRKINEKQLQENKKETRKNIEVDNTIHKDNENEDDLDNDDNDIDEDIIDDDEENEFSNTIEVSKKKKILSYLEPLQECFQSGAVQSGNLSVFAWNTIGTIESLQLDQEYNTVKIDFFDKSSRKLIKFNDQYNFHIAALGEESAAFACKISEDIETGKTIPSVVFYRAFDSWDKSGIWHHPLPIHEEAESIAVGEGWCAVSTSKQFVRIFTSSGLHQSVYSLSGPIVAMSGTKSFLVVVYHSGQAIEGSSCLSYHWFCIKNSSSPTFKLISKGSLPLSKQSQLSWIGWSDTQMFLSFDTKCVLRGLRSCNDWEWTPLLVKSNQPELSSISSLFCIGVVMDKLLYIPLSRGSRCPNIQSKQRPIPSTITLSIPLGQNTDKTEQSLYLKSILLENRSHLFSLYEDLEHAPYQLSFAKEQAEMDKMILQMFQAACKQDKRVRAIDLLRCLQLEKSFTIALTIARHFSLNDLIEEVENLIEKQFSSVEEDSNHSLVEYQDRKRNATNLTLHQMTNSSVTSPAAVASPPVDNPNDEEVEIVEHDENSIPNLQEKQVSPRKTVSMNPFANPTANNSKRKGILAKVATLLSPIQTKRLKK